MTVSSAAQQGSTKPHAKYERLIAKAKGVEAVKTLVVHPCDESSLRGALQAAEAGIKTVVEKMKGVARKSRVTFYYLLAEATGTLYKLG